MTTDRASEHRDLGNQSGGGLGRGGGKEDVRRHCAQGRGCNPLTLVLQRFRFRQLQVAALFVFLTYEARRN